MVQVFPNGFSALEKKSYLFGMWPYSTYRIWRKSKHNISDIHDSIVLIWDTYFVKDFIKGIP